MSENKRVYPRFLYTEPVSYAFPEVAVRGSIAGNISLGGISLKVQEFVPMGVLLELQIRLDQSSRIIWVKAKVVWVREVSSYNCYEIGLEFIKDEECIKAVGKYINTYRPKLTNQVRS